MNAQGKSNETEREEGFFVDPRIYQAIVIASGLELYAKTGMKANRAYTPANMLKTASLITGKTYKRGQYIEAANDLRDFATEVANDLKESNQ